MTTKYFYMREYCRESKTNTSVTESFYINNKKVTRAEFTNALYNNGMNYTTFIRQSVAEAYCIGQTRVETAYIEVTTEG